MSWLQMFSSFSGTFVIHKNSLDLSVDMTVQWSRRSTHAKRSMSNRDFYALLFFMPFVMKGWVCSLSGGIYPRPVSHNLAQTWERLKSQELKMLVYSGFSGFVLVLNNFFLMPWIPGLRNKFSSTLFQPPTSGWNQTWSVVHFQHRF